MSGVLVLCMPESIVLWIESGEKVNLTKDED